MCKRKSALSLLLLLCCFALAFTQSNAPQHVKLIPLAEGWASNSVNAVIFRRNSLVTQENTQFAAFYDPEQYLVLAKRKHGSEKWALQRTPYQGNAADAHNAISIMVDGAGFLHVSWDHHGNRLHYARSTRPGSMELGEQRPMTGQQEDNVTYPEFYRLPDGNLLFFYRYGVSGNGNLIINRYDTKTQTWSQVQRNLLDGQGERNAYWQACVDAKGTIHISWVWRESWDVVSNHDICYTRSTDGGQTWENSSGKAYSLPITAETAEVAQHVPQNSELINQTSMTTDSEGNPVIASYWRAADSQVPQYRLVFRNGQAWQALPVSSRTTPFSLSGGGTKRIPISRPQVLLRKVKGKEQAFLVFRDAERNEKVSVAICGNFPEAGWRVADLTANSVGSWEPTYDTERWKTDGVLDLFLQKVEQVDGEGLAAQKPEMVHVLEWKPARELCF